MGNLRKQLGDFVGPPSKRIRRKQAAKSEARDPNPLPRMGSVSLHPCTVCGRETRHHCLKLSKGRGDRVRCLSLVLSRDIHEAELKAKFSSAVDQSQYVAFFVCTDPGHVPHPLGAMS